MAVGMVGSGRCRLGIARPGAGIGHLRNSGHQHVEQQLAESGLCGVAELCPKPTVVPRESERLRRMPSLEKRCSSIWNAVPNTTAGMDPCLPEYRDTINTASKRRKAGGKPLLGEFDDRLLEQGPAYGASLDALDIALELMSRLGFAPTIVVLLGAGLLAWAGAQAAVGGPAPHLFARYVALAAVLCGYFVVLGSLVVLLFRSAKLHSAIITAVVGVLISTVGVVATPFAVLALTLALRYAVQGICSIEVFTCSESIQYAHAALWAASKYPRLELLLIAVALFFALGVLAAWQSRGGADRAA